jgi:acyl-CoA dehydrogenase
MTHGRDALTSLGHELVDPDVAELADRVFREHPARFGNAGSDSPLDIWSALRSAGLDSLTSSEASGGGGGKWLDAAAVLSAGARHGLATPFVEHDLLAGWALDQAGIRSHSTLRTLAVVDETGVAQSVGWASYAESIVVLSWDGGTLRLDEVLAADADITPGVNLAGEPRDTVRIDLARLGAHEVDPDLASAISLRGALARAVQISGSLRSACQMTVEHLAVRHQFGRPLARFQVLQHAVADSFAETLLVEHAAHAACQAMDAAADAPSSTVELRVGVARSCASHAVDRVVRTAHQLHGAIGTTAEHPLHRITLPALAWRSEFGTVDYWDGFMTAAVACAGADGLWSLLLAEPNRP